MHALMELPLNRGVSVGRRSVGRSAGRSLTTQPRQTCRVWNSPVFKFVLPPTSQVLESSLAGELFPPLSPRPFPALFLYTSTPPLPVPSLPLPAPVPPRLGRSAFASLALVEGQQLGAAALPEAQLPPARSALRAAPRAPRAERDVSAEATGEDRRGPGDSQEDVGLHKRQRHMRRAWDELWDSCLFLSGGGLKGKPQGNYTS